MAELAGAADRTQTKQFDVRREVVFAHRLVVHERGAQVFLIVVAEDGDDGGVRRDFVLGAQSGEEVAARRDPHSQAKIKGELLRHEDGVAGVGEAQYRADLALLEELSQAMSLTSICGLGQIAPAPIQSVLKHFRAEIDAHVLQGQCPSGICFSASARMPELPRVGIRP